MCANKKKLLLIVVMLVSTLAFADTCPSIDSLTYNMANKTWENSAWEGQSEKSNKPIAFSSVIVEGGKHLRLSDGSLVSQGVLPDPMVQCIYKSTNDIALFKKFRDNNKSYLVIHQQSGADSPWYEEKTSVFCNKSINECQFKIYTEL